MEKLVRIKEIIPIILCGLWTKSSLSQHWEEEEKGTLTSVAVASCIYTVSGAEPAVSPGLRDCRGLVAGEPNRKHCEKAVCCDFSRDEVRPSSYWKVCGRRLFLHTALLWPLNLLLRTLTVLNSKDYKGSSLLYYAYFSQEETRETLRGDYLGI